MALRAYFTIAPDSNGCLLTRLTTLEALSQSVLRNPSFFKDNAIILIILR